MFVRSGLAPILDPGAVFDRVLPTGDALTRHRSHGVGLVAGLGHHRQRREGSRQCRFRQRNGLRCEHQRGQRAVQRRIDARDRGGGKAQFWQRCGEDDIAGFVYGLSQQAGHDAGVAPGVQRGRWQAQLARAVQIGHIAVPRQHAVTIDYARSGCHVAGFD